MRAINSAEFQKTFGPLALLSAGPDTHFTSFLGGPEIVERLGKNLKTIMHGSSHHIAQAATVQVTQIVHGSLPTAWQLEGSVESGIWASEMFFYCSFEEQLVASLKNEMPFYIRGTEIYNLSRIRQANGTCCYCETTGNQELLRIYSKLPKHLLADHDLPSTCHPTEFWMKPPGLPEMIHCTRHTHSLHDHTIAHQRHLSLHTNDT